MCNPCASVHAGRKKWILYPTPMDDLVNEQLSDNELEYVQKWIIKKNKMVKNWLKNEDLARSEYQKSLTLSKGDK